MTPQEAREILQQIRKQKCVTECDCGCQLYELETFCLEEKALDTAIKALEKDIPKCVKVEKWINTYCPNGCGQVLSIHHGDGYYSIQHEPDRCPNCGQVLEWEDAE